MKITKKQIIQLIKEELRSLLEQSEANIIIKNFEDIENNEQGVTPVMYGDQLIEVWEDSLTAFFDRDEIGWNEMFSDEEMAKIIKKFDDDLELFFKVENWNQFGEMMLPALDPEFKGIPSGYLAFSEDAITNLLTTYTPGETIQIEGLDKVKNLEKHRVKLNISIGSNLGAFKVGDGYIVNLEEHEMMHSTDRYLDINLRRIIEDINLGKLKIRIEHDVADGILYTLVKY